MRSQQHSSECTSLDPVYILCGRGSHSGGCLVALSVQLHGEPLIWEPDPPNPVHAQSGRGGGTVLPPLFAPTRASSTSEHTGVAQTQGLASGCHSLVPGKEAQGRPSLSPTGPHEDLATGSARSHREERRGSQGPLQVAGPVGTSQGDFPFHIQGYILHEPAGLRRVTT